MLRMIFHASGSGRLPEDLEKRFSPENAERVREFHRKMPEYAPTPLVRLDHLAKFAHIGQILVKDESPRFGLNAFKALGSSFAMERALEKCPGGRRVFVTATDGNHGRGVAWAAKRLGCGAVVLLPKGTSPERVRRIRELGAEARVTDLDYDRTVLLAAKTAQEHGWILMQDTAWKGYEDIPTAVMEGYLTMASEIAEQIGDTAPTHIFLQAGVGSMAAALAACFKKKFAGKNSPRIVVVESDKADCFYLSAEGGGAEGTEYTGIMDSMMAGLCCGVPNPIAWTVLRECADAFCTISDDICADGMRVLSSPLPGDGRIVSGESGAAGFAALWRLATDEKLESVRERMGLDENARALCVSTEGATDTDNWRNVVWYGRPRR